MFSIEKELDQVIYAKMYRTSDGLFVCTECGTSSRLRINLRNHIEARHVKTEGFYCPICNMHCSSRNAVASHKTRYHKIYR